MLSPLLLKQKHLDIGNLLFELSTDYIKNQAYICGIVHHQFKTTKTWTRALNPQILNH